jgi:polyisoprenoid-binding protein YceI
MKNLTLLVVLVSCFAGLKAQHVFYSKTAHIWFFSSTPIEDIEAHNKKSTCAIDIEKNIVEFKITMKDFLFEKSLMQEHFNENYVESDAYPIALFKGTFVNFSDLDFNLTTPQQATVKGTMTIHGKENVVETTGTLQRVNNELKITAKFTLKPGDYNIKIPTLVIKNIAEVIDVHVDASLNELKPKK